MTCAPAPIKRSGIRTNIAGGTKLTAAICACFFWPLSAAAFDSEKLPQTGSLGLDETMHLIGQSSQLMREVADALDATGKTAENVLCVGMRFPWGWEHLAGERVSPYHCEFAPDKWLEIRADVVLEGKGGGQYETQSREAMKQTIAVVEKNPNWKWLSKSPFGDQ